MWSQIVRLVHRRQRGVTLVELGVVLAIVGVLIALAIPRYIGARKQAYKDEAYHVLQEVKTLEWGFYLQSFAFTGTLSSTGFVMPGGSHWSSPSLTLSGNGNNGNGNGNGNCNGNGNGNGNNGNGNGNGNCNGSGSGPSVVITLSGQLIPLAGIDQVSLTLNGDGSTTVGSTF